MKLTDAELAAIRAKVEADTAQGTPQERAERMQAARQQAIQAKRMELFHQAEQMLVDQQVLIPLYYYVSTAMVRTTVAMSNRSGSSRRNFTG